MIVVYVLVVVYATFMLIMTYLLLRSQKDITVQRANTEEAIVHPSTLSTGNGSNSSRPSYKKKHLTIDIASPSSREHDADAKFIKDYYRVHFI